MSPYTESGKKRMEEKKEREREEEMKERLEGKDEKKGDKKDDRLRRNRAKRLEQPEIDLESEDLYELFGVVIHSGGAYGGHYHTFIRDLNTQNGEDGLDLDPPPKYDPEEEEKGKKGKKGRRGKKEWKKKEDEAKSTENKAGNDEKQQEKMKSDEAQKGENGEETKKEEEKPKEEEETEEEWRKELERKGFKEGKWFDFDDSSIRRIPVEKLATQFGGSGEGAYMLIYRKCSLNRTLSSSTESGKDELEGFPDHLKEDLTRENERIRVDREKFLKAQNEITLNILLEEECILDQGKNMKKKVTEKPTENEEEGEETKKEEEKQRRIVIDKRSDFKSALETLKSQIPQLTEGNWKITEVKKGENNRMHVIKTLDSESKENLSELGLVEDSFLFIWDGKQVNGEEWDGLGAQCIFKLKKKGLEDEAEQPPMEISMRENERVSFLIEKVVQMTGIPSEYLSLLANGRPLNSYHNKLFLFASNIYDGTFLLARDKRELEERKEENDQENNSSEAGKDENNKKKPEMDEAVFLLTVVNSIPHSQSTRFVVDADPYASIFELKRKILSRLETNYTLDEVKLGRIIGNSVQQFFSEESASLLEVGIEDEAMITIEVGQIESRLIKIRYRFMKDGKITSLEAKELEVDPRGCVEDLKVTMAANLCKEADQMRLRRTDRVFETPTDLIQDESVTIESLELDHEELLLLEEGRPPKKGEIRVFFYRFSSKMVKGTNSNSPYVSASIFSTWAQERLSCEESGELHSLFFLDIMSTWTVDELKAHLVSQPLLNEVSSSYLFLYFLDSKENF